MHPVMSINLSHIRLNILLSPLYTFISSASQVRNSHFFLPSFDFEDFGVCLLEDEEVEEDVDEDDGAGAAAAPERPPPRPPRSF